MKSKSKCIKKTHIVYNFSRDPSQLNAFSHASWFEVLDLPRDPGPSACEARCTMNRVIVGTHISFHKV